MPSTFFGLDIGYTGLNIYQGALHTTSHNITNAETKGYSRQELFRQAGKAISIHSSYGMVGTGVVGLGVGQIRDNYYDEKYRVAKTLYGEYAGKSYYMGEIENYFNEVTAEGFTTNFSSMFTSLEELSKDPSSGSARRQVINFSLAMTEYFNSMSNSLKSVQEECNFEIKNCVDRLNTIGEQIATLTKQINTIEITGSKANDLRDQRNLLIDELSELVNVTVSEQKVGATEGETSVGLTSYSVKVNGRYLVNDYQYNTIELIPREEPAQAGDVKGLYDLTWSDGQNFELYGELLGGKLAALIDVRDGNNADNLHGTISASAGDTEVTMVGTNVNNISQLNIPEEGVVVVGNQEYRYEGFEVEIDPDTGEYTYTFHLDESKPVVSDADEAEGRVGRSVNYKGIPYYLAQMNEFVRTFAREFNELHKTGEDLNGNKGIEFFNGTHPVTGANYTFADILNEEEDIYGFSSSDETYYKLNAGNFTVTKAIYEDADLFAAADSISQGVEENKVLAKLLALKDDIGMFKQGKPESFFQSLIADVGIDTRKANQFTDSQNNIVNAIDNQRISISGVDTDEEAMNLIRFQTAYNLSAKVISVMDEIYNKLINEMAV